jgi:hypothetical protein
VDLVLWSMRELNVFPVLETRVVTRVGRAVARRAPRAEVSVVIAGPPALRTGARDYRAFVYDRPGQVPREVPPPAGIGRADSPRFGGGVPGSARR